MSSPLDLRAVVLTAAGEAELGYGVLGFVSLQLGALRLDGLRLRRLGDGRLVLSWPYRKGAAGRRRYFVRPTEESVRASLERQVFAALSAQGHLGVPQVQPAPCLIEARWHSTTEFKSS